MKQLTCAPNPNLLESMRSVGYTLNTAIADIIDNSIAANARHINIQYFDHGEEPYIAIVDDGDGMDEATAIDAMQLAGYNPKLARSQHDLGRFGLGLKTASLSQARSLLICTIHDGIMTTLRWDLDTVARTGEWSLELLNDVESRSSLPEKVSNVLMANHGTCVLWRKLDKLETIAGSSLTDLDKVMFDLTDYLALVFHRFTYPYPSDDIQQITVEVNGLKIPQRDPFLVGNPAVQPTASQRVGTSRATLRGYTLPYQNHLSPADKKLLNISEEKGKTLTDTQGFYIYRAYRLITWGSWFRMLPRRQATKLCRVCVDIPNSLDSEWTLDIKKSTATPPKLVSEVMRRYVDQLSKPSRLVQQFRGRKTSTDPEAPVWDVIRERDGLFRYEINQQNPYLSSFMTSLTSQQKQNFNTVVKILSETLPYEDMQSRFAIDERSISAKLSDEDARTYAQQMWMFNTVIGLSPKQFVDRFKDKEPISLCPNGEAILKEVANDE